MPRVHAFTDDALRDLDAVGVVRALHAGEVSAPEVVDAAIARTEAVDPELGAVAWRSWDRARAEAGALRGGFFAGVPTFVKDNVDVAGMPTLQGTDAYVGTPAVRDGDFARMYLATGLVALGKTRLSEYGFNAAVEHPRLGPVRNPWDPEHTAGASSAGSAALVAAGAVPIAHANDGGGSIRIPAAVNGLVGLKPTRGRLAQDAMLRGQPVAVHTGGAGRSADAETIAATWRTATLLEELGHHVEEVPAPVPDSFPEDFLLYWATLAGALVAGGRRNHGRTFDRARLDPLTTGLARHAARSAHRIPGAIARLRRTAGQAERFHERWDVALTPTLASAAPPIGHLSPEPGFDQVMERLLDWVVFTPWQNATGAPAVSLPLATTAEGLPLGMMLAAAPGREALLLELSYELEQARPFPTLT